MFGLSRGGRTEPTAPVDGVESSRSGRQRRQATARAVGIDISAEAIRAAWVQGERIETAEVRLPQGAVTGGEIRDNSAVIAGLRELWATHKPPTRAVVIGLANQDIVTRPLSMPRLSAKDLRSALPFELADMVPFPIEDATIDVLPMGNDAPSPQAPLAAVADASPDPAGGSPGPSGAPPLGDDARWDDVQLLAVVALASTVRQAMGIAKSAGLRLVAVDSTSLALVRSAGRTDVDTHAVVHLGPDALLVTVHHRGVVQFCRSIVTQQSSNLSGEIEEELVFIEQFRRRAAGAESLATGDDLRDHPLVAAIRGTLEYAGSQHGALPVDAVSLVGDDERCADTAAPLARALGVPVHVVDPIQRVAEGVGSIGRGAAFAGAAGLALVAGADVPGPRRVDLIPRANPSTIDPWTLAIRATGSALAAAAVLGLVTIAVGPDVGGAEARAASAERAAASVNKELNAVADIRADVRDTRLLEQRMGQVALTQTDWGRLANEITLAAPADVTVVSITGKGPDKRARQKSGGTIEISAQAPNQTSISTWMRSLASVEGLRDPWLSNAATAGGRGQLGAGFTSFTLTVQLTDGARVQSATAPGGK